MTIENFDKLYELVSNTDCLEKVFKKNIDWDALLDDRDDGEFDEAWVEENKKLQELKFIRVDDEASLTKLREMVFKKVYALTDSSELAGYASDDFGIIGEKIVKNVKSDWISMLLEKYLSGTFPS